MSGKKFPCPLEEPFGDGRVVFAAAFGEVLELRLLFGVEFGWDFHGDADEEVATAATAQVWHTFASKFECCSALGSGRDFQGNFPVESGGMDFTAERGGGEGYGEFAEEVVALARKNGVGLNMDNHVEVAAITAANAGFAMTGGAKAHTMFDATGDFEFDA